MKKSLPCLPALASLIMATAAIAQSAPAASADAALQSVSNATSHDATDGVAVGDRLLMQAAGQLERRASVSARLRHQVAIDGKQLYGVGSYWQQGSGEELKVRLELQIAGQEAKLIQVSNSRFLWIDRRLPTGRNVTRIDLRQLRADPILTASNLDEIQPGEANWSAMQPELTAHSGGLPSLIVALEENFSFLPPQAMRLAIAPPLASQPTNVPVFAVVGHWKHAQLLALLKNDKAKESGDTESKHEDFAQMVHSLPERFPHEVLLLVGQADLFPYRIEYRRLETPLPSGNDAPPIPYQLSVHPMVVLELSDVTFDAPIAAGQFDYAPGDADWVDHTAVLLERLRRDRRGQVATRNNTESLAPPRR